MRAAVLIAALSLTACGGGHQPVPPVPVVPPAPAPSTTPPPPPPLSGVILVGDELVADWQQTDPVSYPTGARNAGVAGATTGQLAARFLADVIARRPAVVVLSGGLNDLRTAHYLDDNAGLFHMAEQAAVEGICVVLVDVLPVNRPAQEFPDNIQTYNLGRKVWAEAYYYRYVAAFGPLAAAGKLQAAYDSGDGFHINAAGYAVLGPLVTAGIAQCP